MTSAAVATATSPLWFATRATGLMALVLLTCTVLLGILTSVRFARPAWPRFVTVSLHRNLSLLTITFTGLHVLTTVTDPFASIASPVGGAPVHLRVSADLARTRCGRLRSAARGPGH